MLPRIQTSEPLLLLVTRKRLLIFEDLHLKKTPLKKKTDKKDEVFMVCIANKDCGNVPTSVLVDNMPDTE